MYLEVIGEQVPNGTVRISGAKNSATRLMAAATLTHERVHVENFPTELLDVKVKAGFLSATGISIETNSNKESFEICAEEINIDKLEHYNYPIRTTYLLAAGQLLRKDEARIPFPEGCKIGNRKYDLHLMVWEKMGCRVEELDDHIHIRGNLTGAEITFPFPTVGGTENALLCSSIAKGTTTIRNAYISPEVSDLIGLLGSMGAEIRVLGNTQIQVEGKQSLSGTTYRVMPDRIEALTWIVYAILSRGIIFIEDVPFETMEVPLIHLKEAGVDLFSNSSGVCICPRCLKSGTIQPFELACGTHPGIISDMQPFFVLLGLKADGRSRIIDYRYPGRTIYLTELAKMCPSGALDWSSTGEIITKGPVDMYGSTVNSTDLRGSMAVLIAGLLAKGTTTVSKVDMALRGYNKLTDKLSKLGIQYRMYDD